MYKKKTCNYNKKCFNINTMKFSKITSIITLFVVGIFALPAVTEAQTYPYTNYYGDPYTYQYQGQTGFGNDYVFVSQPEPDYSALINQLQVLIAQLIRRKSPS